MSAEPVIKPHVTKQQAEQLCSELYGWQAVRCKEVVSYDDRNFVIEARRSDWDSSKELVTFVLKVTNCAESDERIEQQNHLIQSLSSAGFRVQSVQQSINGKLLEKVTFNTAADTSGRLIDREHAVRLLTYIPGKRMSDFKLDGRIIESCAAAVGKVNAFLTEKFLSLNAEQINEPPLWSLLSCKQLLQYVQFVKNEKDRDIYVEIVNEFERVVMKERYEEFTKAYIHGDPNESNILVDDSNNSVTEFAGLLDWQDSHVAFAECDLALIVMYSACELSKQQPTGCNPLQLVAPAAIRGYTSCYPLPDGTLQLLPLLVAARFVQSLVLGAYSFARDPTNDYLLTTACSAPVVRDLWLQHRGDIEGLGRGWLQLAKGP